MPPQICFPDSLFFIGNNNKQQQQVSSIRSSIRSFESSLQNLSTKLSYSVSNPSPSLTSQITQTTEELHASSQLIKNRISTLGTKVGRDEGRRAHFETLKTGLGRAVQKFHTIERAQRERVKERVARQYKIGRSNSYAEQVSQWLLSDVSLTVKPEATEEEVALVLESNSIEATSIFANAVRFITLRDESLH